MGRETRGYDDGYDERDDRRRPPAGRDMPTRGPQTPPGRVGSGNGRGTSASDPTSRRTIGGYGAPPPRAPGRAGDTPTRGPSRAGDTPGRSTRGGRPPDDAYGETPGRSERRSVGQMARDASRSVSRQLSSVMQSTGRVMRREASTIANAGRSGALGTAPAMPPGGVGALEGGEIIPQRYRRSRIRMRARKWRQGRVQANPIGYAIGIASVAMLVVTLLGAGGTGGVYAFSYYNQHRDQIQSIAGLRYGQSTVILDRNGKLLYTVKGDNSGYNYYIPLSQISPKLREATIDTEDHTFYQPSNIGIDFVGTARSALVDTTSGGQAQQGGSTITQQLVKNIVLGDRSKALQRKLNEMILAIGVTQNYNKDQILEMYLNTIDYGDQNTGIEAAARNFFGLEPTNNPDGTQQPANMGLSWAQSALLAGLPNAPTYYLPIQYSCDKAPCAQKDWDNPCLGDPTLTACVPNPKYSASCGKICYGHEWLDWRRARVVLDSVRAFDPSFSQSEYTAALKEVTDILVNQQVKHWAGLQTGSTHNTTKIAPSFVDYVLKDLADNWGVEHPETAGLTVYTTLDLNLEKQAETSLTYYINQPHKNLYTAYATNDCGRGIDCPLAKRDNAHDGAVIAIDSRDGDILAMAGSVDYGNRDKLVAGFNNLTTAPRSLGSSTKPLVYATAFQMGWYPAIEMHDQPLCFPNPISSTEVDPDAPNCKGWYAPRNFNANKYAQDIPARIALADSLNIPATEALAFVGDTPDNSVNFLSMAQRLGITSFTKNAMGPTTALGTQVMPLIDLTSAYGTLGNGGKRAPYRDILRIEDSAGNYWQAPAAPPTAQVISPQAAFMVTDALTDNEARGGDFGYRNPLFFNDPNFAPNNQNFQPVAVKTGTSQGKVGPTDIVTVGYSPYMALGVWVGNADGSDMTPGVIGIDGAGYIFHDLMAWSIQNYKWPTTSRFAVPPGIARGVFNCTSGLAPYKGVTTVDPCKPTGNWNFYSEFNQGTGANQHLNSDWYIQGQVPQQS